MSEPRTPFRVGMLSSEVRRRAKLSSRRTVRAETIYNAVGLEVKRPIGEFTKIDDLDNCRIVWHYIDVDIALEKVQSGQGRPLWRVVEITEAE